MTRKKADSQARFLAQVKEWPTSAGVYVMRDEMGRILYIGKAKNLRNRIRSYFQKARTLTPKTRLLVKRITTLEYTVTNTELEALLLECNLIKKHRPRYNVRLKDDKNFPYFVLDFTHPFPQFRVTRKVKQLPHLKYFGPFSGSVKDISRFLLKTFQIRDCTDTKFKSHHSRPCLNYEIGTCTAPCAGLVVEQDYSKQVSEAILFLRGQRKELLKEFKKEMQGYSDRQEYENAKAIRDKIFNLKKVTQKQDAVLTENMRNIDVLGIHQNEEEVQWVILFIRNGILNGRKTFKTNLGVDKLVDAIGIFLQQFYLVSLIPDEIWLMNNFPDRDSLEKSLSDTAGKKIKIKVKRGEKSIRLLGMAEENAKLLYQTGKKKTEADASEELGKVLGLKETPTSIEGVDVSNLGESSAFVSLVHFEDGHPFKSQYRLYHPRTVDGQNDFAMIQEVVARRYGKPDSLKPDLLLIDGGKGQLNAAVRALEEIKLDIPICSLAKAKTFSSFTSKSVEKTEERIFLPGRKNPILLKEGNPALRLLQQIRDEAHRFAITSHRKHREKEAIEGSDITSIKGIGKTTREKLLKYFESLEQITSASAESLKEAGLTKRQVEQLRKHLSQ